MRAREDREVGWPADQVERWPIDRLIPYAKNSRTHSEAQIAQLTASMKEWGWTNPVLADEAGGVIAGARSHPGSAAARHRRVSGDGRARLDRRTKPQSALSISWSVIMQ